MDRISISTSNSISISISKNKSMPVDVWKYNSIADRLVFIVNGTIELRDVGYNLKEVLEQNMIIGIDEYNMLITQFNEHNVERNNSNSKMNSKMNSKDTVSNENNNMDYHLDQRMKDQRKIYLAANPIKHK